MSRIVLIVALLGAVACDPRANDGVTQAGVVPAAPPRAPSRETESCAATADCESGFRCVDDVCRRETTSRLGEYHWTSGEVLAEKGKVADAVAAFQLAMTQFDTDKVEPPAGLLCSYGAALRRQKNDEKALEQAARLLHRCLLQTPPGAADRGRALRELVELEEAGLEPTLLSRDTPADTYLVRAPRRPQVSAVRVDVAQTAPHRDRGYAAWVKLVQAEDTVRLYRPCFERYVTDTSKTSLTVTMPLKLKAQLGDDDVYVGGTLDIAPDPAAGGPEAIAGQCVRDALAPVAATFARNGSSGSWAGTITLSLRAAE